MTVQPWIMIFFNKDHLPFFSGMHCSEKGHKENVCHEVYEQTSVRGAQWGAQCLQRAPNNAEPRAPFPGQFLVSFSKSLSDSLVLKHSPAAV